MHFISSHYIAVIAIIIVVAILAALILPNYWTMRRLRWFLDECDVKYQYWGPIHGTNTLEDLLEELRCGEATIECKGADQPPNHHIYVSVVWVWCMRNGKWLLLREYRHSGPDQKLEQRPFKGSIGEAVRVKFETYTDAAHRGLKEELGFIDPARYTLLEGPDEESDPQPSEKYAGMCDVYHRRHFTVTLEQRDGLYKTDYPFTTSKDHHAVCRWIEHQEGPPESCVRVEPKTTMQLVGVRFRTD